MIATCFTLAFVAFVGAMYMTSDVAGWKCALPDQKMRRSLIGLALLSISSGLSVLGVILWLWA